MSRRSQSAWPKSPRPNGGTPSTDDLSHSLCWRKNQFSESFHSCNGTAPGAWLQPRHLHMPPRPGHTGQPVLLPAIVQDPLQNAAITLAQAGPDQGLAGQCLGLPCQPPSTAIFVFINADSHNGNSQTHFVFQKSCASSSITQNIPHTHALFPVAVRAKGDNRVSKRRQFVVDKCGLICKALPDNPINRGQRSVCRVRRRGHKSQLKPF